MRLFHFTISALFVAPLALTGCPGDDGSTTETTEAATGSTTSTTEPMTTTMMVSSSDGMTDGSTTDDPPPVDCQEPREVPASPYDCAGVDGVLEGSVIVDDTAGSDDPAMLEGIAVVTGAIRFSNTDITNLDVMGCVTEVGADITIFNNDMLTDVNGLHNVTSIGTEFVFSGNDALVDFNSLPNIQQMNTTLSFQENASLETISGFHSFVGISSEVINPVTMMPDLTGNITIQRNDVLRDINGLGGLRVVGGNFAVTNNPMLCISSVDCVGAGITMPMVPPVPDGWSTQNNDESC